MARRPALIAKKTKTPRISYNESLIINKKYMGDEPVLSGSLEKIEFGKALNWYNCMRTNDDARGYLVDYLKQNGLNSSIKLLGRVPDAWFPVTLGWVARLIVRGAKLPEESKNYFTTKLKETLDRAQPASAPHEVKERASVQDRMREKSHDIIGEIESLIDQGDEFSMYDWLKQNEVPAAYSNMIALKYAPWLDELLEAIVGTDSQLVEAYKHWTKKALKARIVFLNKLMADCERYGNVVKKTRAPRRPRAISIEKKLKYVKFQKESEEYKVASVGLEKVIGCQELWCFNTKNKTVTVFRALDRGGLQFNRTAITGFDEKTSFTKGTGRKTAIIVDKIQKGGKLVLRKLMDELGSVKALQERINEHTMLLKVMS